MISWPKVWRNLTIQKSFMLSLQCIKHQPMTVALSSHWHVNLLKLGKTVCLQSLGFWMESWLTGRWYWFQTQYPCKFISFPSDLYSTIFNHLWACQPDLMLHSHLAIPTSQSSIPLLNKATFFDQVIIDNERYLASSWSSQGMAYSLVTVCTSTNEVWVGELHDIFLINQPKLGAYYFGWM